jgi:hypothetical protein
LCLAQQFVRNIQSGSHGRNLGVFFVVGKLKHRRGEGVRAKIKNAGRGCPAWRGWRVVTIRLFAKRRIVIAGLVIRWGREVGWQTGILVGCGGGGGRPCDVDWESWKGCRSGFSQSG